MDGDWNEWMEKERFIFLLSPQNGQLSFFAVAHIVPATRVPRYIVYTTKACVLYGVQLILCTQNHDSYAVVRFSSYFFTAHLSDPYNAMLHKRPVTPELRPHGVRAASRKMQNAMVRAVRSPRAQKQLRGISVGRREDS